MSYMNKIIASSKPSAMKIVGQVTKAASKAKEIDQAYRKEAADAKKDPEYLKMMADKPAPTKKKKGKGLKSACWKGYEAIGMKKKGGRKVPNCVPKK
jgi:hypothetical protein